MTLQEIERQVYQLSVTERLALITTIARSLQQEIPPLHTQSQSSDLTEPNHPDPLDKIRLVEQLRGCLKRPSEPAPTDEEIEKMREERLVEKYLK
ncbi:MAG: hypothetical protein VKJ24_06040 [Synechococcales bacterium]|nr:hypothetical protein [Synechococcales bacterium]